MTLASEQQIQVLHVDDEPSLTDLTATFLEREDDKFTVETANNASEGLEQIDSHLPDCIVSDYNMPGMDGLELLQGVREDNPDLPFILFTGKGGEEVASEAISADVTDYLQKGSGSETYELLANRIRNAVNTRRETKRADRQEQLMRLTEFAGNTGGFELERKSGTILLTVGARRIIKRPDQTEIPVEEAIELFHPDDRESIQQALDKGFQLKPGDELQDTWRLQPGDGDEHLLDITITPVVENGDVTGLRGAGNNITDRKERQQKLTQIETLFQHTQDALFFINVADEPTVKRVNPAYEDEVGLSASEIQGQTPRELLGEQYGGRVEAKYNECIQRQEPLQYKETARLNGGKSHWTTKIAPVVVDGTVEYVVGSTRDITERKERRRELEEYETIIEALTDAVYVLDEEGRFTYVTDEFVELVGYDRGTILGNTPSLIKDEEAVEQAEHQLGRLLSSDGPETLTFEVTLHPREGDPIVCEDRMGVLPYEGDQFNGSVGTLRDVTHRKKREQELQELKTSTRH
ncbi:PAS domain S-box protein [Halorubrum sp. N11]|uniref:PAS domain-containing protein n=1 Tax=Halorubrum sp. N11 TaxID=3402276 RepID=UPI003EBD10FB